MTRPAVIHHTPLPPARNGIADYAWRMMEALKPYCRQSVVTGTSDGKAPKGIRVHTRAARAPHGLNLYQIGNNWHHTQELRTALVQPGLVLLHDLNLLYLYESLALSDDEMVGLARRSNLRLSQRTAERLLNKQPTPKLPYMLASMLPELISRSHRVVVHSRYAKQFIRAHHGDDAAQKVDVIPHFAMAADAQDPQMLRQKLGFDDTDKLIVTAGFATRAKRFNIIARAVGELARKDPAIRWIHAGAPDHGDFNLQELTQAHSSLEGRFHTTGYLDEQALDDHVAIADILLNLRFPSVGESSGSLARALGMGICTLVSDTGSYAEIPDMAVAKMSALGGAEELKFVLSHLLNNPAMRRAIGEGAARYAADELNMGRYAERLAQSIRQARNHAARKTLTQPFKKLTAWMSPETEVQWIGPLGQETPNASLAIVGADAPEDLRYAIDPSPNRPGAYIGARHP